MISPQSKKRIEALIQSGINEGAKCLLDGRNITVPKYEKGNFVGPTVLADVTVNEITENLSFYISYKKIIITFLLF